MTYESKIKAMAAGVTATLFASMLTIGVMYRNNSLLTEDVKAEKVRTESLTAEKASLKSEMERLKNDLAGFTTKNKELNKAIEEAKYKVASKEAEIARMTKQNAATVQQLKKENDAVKKIRQELLAQLEGMKQSNIRLEAEVAELNQTIAALRKENEVLYARSLEKPLMAYNFRVESVKKRKDKLTVKAKKMHKLNISFDVNSSKKLAGDIYIKLSSEKADEMPGETLMAFEEVPALEEMDLWASTETTLLSTEEYKRYTVAFDPKDKMKEGVYYVRVYSGNNYLGSSQFKLR
ncbi:hypothetical protein [Nafulsella turpanensis]|uniref:hypothetical protein n=1 Tax=Nafulsella turpanensis TaxID=1265690 RepID=UPI000347DFBC|nr:hypothetical protein [Nafulsella turpanensis]